MRYGYVLCREHNSGRITWWFEPLEIMDIDPKTANAADLRRWALDLLRSKDHNDGKYCALYVELDEDDQFDWYEPIEAEDVIWYNFCEMVPAGTGGQR